MKSKTSLRLWLLLCSSLTVMAGATLAPSLPDMAEAFSRTPNIEFWVKMMVAIPGVVIALSAYFLGRCLDQFSKFHILILSLFAYGVLGCAGFFLHDNIWVLLISRAALGFAVAGVMVAVTVLAAEYFHGQALQKYMGMQAAFGSFGGVVFLFFSGALAVGNWRYPFLLHGLAFVLLLAVPFLMMPLRELANASIKNRFALPRYQQSSSQQSSLPHLSSHMPQKKVLILFCALAFLEVLLLYTIPLYFPFYLIENFALNSDGVGLVMALVFLIIAITSTFYGKLKSRTGFMSLQMVGLCSLVSGFLMLGFSEVTLIRFLGMTFLGLGFGVMRPNLVMWLFAHSSPLVRGRVMGLVTSCFFLGQFASPFVFQPIWVGWGEKGVFLAAGCAGIVAFVVLYFLQLTLQTSPGDTPKCFLNASEKFEV